MALVRLKTSVASQTQSWRAGEKYECSESESRLRIERGDAEHCSHSEPHYIPPDGTDAHVIVNQAVREQTTAQQPRKRLASV